MSRLTKLLTLLIFEENTNTHARQNKSGLGLTLTPELGLVCFQL